MRRRDRKAWTLPALLGLAMGLGLGLFIGWMVWPVEYTDVDLVMLERDQQDLYIALTGLTYGVNRDLPAAHERLRALQDPDLISRVEELTGRLIEQAGDRAAARGLAMLARDLGSTSPRLEDYLQRSAPGGSLERQATSPAAIATLQASPRGAP